MFTFIELELKQIYLIVHILLQQIERVAKQPLTAAEHQCARHARLKAILDTWNAYLEKDRPRQRERRVHASPAELSQLRRQNQVSSAKYREKQTGNTNERVIKPKMAYANAASFGNDKSKGKSHSGSPH